MFYRINEATLAAEMKIVDAGVRGGSSVKEQVQSKVDRRWITSLVSTRPDVMP